MTISITLRAAWLAAAMATTSTPRPAWGSRLMDAVPCEASVWPSVDVA